MSLEREYRRARKLRGITVAEFEAERGLPPFSVVPEPRARKYMYRNATREERLTMTAQGWHKRKEIAA